MLKMGKNAQRKTSCSYVTGYEETRIRRLRAVAFVMAFLLVVNSLAACGSSAADTDTEVTENVTGSETTELESVVTTEGTEAEAVEVTEATEATEATETTEAVTENETQTETETETESETEVPSESASESTSGSDPMDGYTITSMNKTMYAKQSVNVRDLPSTDGSKLGSLSSGQAVTVTGQCEETGWYQISFSGKTGTAATTTLPQRSRRPAARPAPVVEAPVEVLPAVWALREARLAAALNRPAAEARQRPDTRRVSWMRWRTR